MSGTGDALKANAAQVTAEEHNNAFDPADEALGGAFKDGFREGWLFAKSPDFEHREEAEEDYPREVDMAPTECWDAYRSHYFMMLPLAAIPGYTAALSVEQAPQPVAVPDGWKLVPMGPTTEMECAPDHEDCPTPDAAKSAYRAMLAAAPPSPLDIVTVSVIQPVLPGHTTCPRCQGNGEIVTDWDRYMRGHEDENGNEAVTECPDCDGEGKCSPSVTDDMVIAGCIAAYGEAFLSWPTHSVRDGKMMVSKVLCAALASEGRE